VGGTLTISHEPASAGYRHVSHGTGMTITTSSITAIAETGR
jgi:hypothetical protein